MGGQGIEIQIETITREEGQTARGQDPSQGVDYHVRCMLYARAEVKHRKNLGAGIDCQPQPKNLCGVAQPGS